MLTDRCTYSTSHSDRHGSTYGRCHSNRYGERYGKTMAMRWLSQTQTQTQTQTKIFTYFCALSAVLLWLRAPIAPNPNRYVANARERDGLDSAER